MIAGIGIDLVKIPRLEKWVKNPSMIYRFFNQIEILKTTCVDKLPLHTREIDSAARHYAARFAAKEAFVKALGTGFVGIDLTDIYIYNDENGKPNLQVSGKAAEQLHEKFGNCNIFVSLTHEKDIAAAVVIIEKVLER